MPVAKPASRGPIPKATNTRRRRNVTPAEESTTKVHGLGTGVPKMPDTAWTEAVKDLWFSLGDSAMSQFYTRADWAFAWVTCVILDEALTVRGLQSGQLNAALVTSCMADLARLGVTEGDRRRLRIEIDRPDDGSEAEIDAIRKGYKGLSLVK